MLPINPKRVQSAVRQISRQVPRPVRRLGQSFGALEQKGYEDIRKTVALYSYGGLSLSKKLPGFEKAFNDVSELILKPFGKKGPTLDELIETRKAQSWMAKK